MRRIAIFALIIYLAGASSSSLSSRAQVQEPAENKGAAAAWRALLRLRSTATVLHTTAHADDEDGALLTWLSRKQGVRTGLLTLTRGEGGANLVGPELYDALGILRTEELLAAGRYYGVDQMFTRVTDFGFSKRLDETLEHWGKDVALGDVVHAIRLYRPDIIVSRFHGKPRDGHGNHQAAGLLSIEAFNAAADPNRFPEHFKEGLRAWQVKKLYLSVRVSEPAATLKIDVGEYDPLTGKSYREIARDGLSHQRSQGAGQVRAAPGSSLTAVTLADSAIPKIENEKSLFDGIDTTIAGMAKLAGATNISPELAEIGNRVEAAISKFDALKPWAVASELSAGMKATRALIEKVKISQIETANKDHLLFLLNNKEREFNDAMNKALGLAIEVLVDPDKPAEGPASFFQPRETFAVAIPGQRFSLTMSVVNRSPVKMDRAEMMLAPREGWDIKGKLPVGDLRVSNSTLREQFDLKVSDNAGYTRPHWSRANELRDHIYQINKPEYLHLSFAPPDLLGVFNYVIEGVRFTLAQPAQTIYVDRPWGEQRRLLTVAPAMNVAISPRIGVIPIAASQASFDVNVTVSNNVKGNATGKVRLKLPQGWAAAPAESNFNFTHEGEVGNFSFKVSVPQVAPGADYKIQAAAEYDGREYVEGYQVIAHRDNEPRHLYRPATMDVRGVEVKIAPNLTVGYVTGVGDEIPKSLEQIGVKVVTLGESDLAKGNLDGFDAIIVGIRATAIRDDLKANSKRLLDYAERGGNLIYQYQTQEFDAAPYGPYPYKLTARAEEVSEEDSKVTILDPSNPIFNWPNKITASDFDGWVEERGSKWMMTWDERYKPLLECHDREQAPQRGGLMYAQYGKGTFVYSAYAFYRQLPAGVQGGYRLFANIISLKKQSR
ncbi:MAG: Mycothiol S-conjugate amidase [Acidobacteria bacterium]|nr:Mycothiol S-conjugate amidase [Acidobacteriota bacterium]